ncbi:hypothetical protein [Arthrobacter subterraneus]|uniref:hypothetical protein n=1 Tax=Arthrobacter subterraneus TaxID=335973 RepID=UPI003814BF31
MQERLLELLPNDGTPRANGVLRKQLGLSEDQYWEVRNALLDQGRVTKLRGRGGRTARVVDSEDVVEQADRGVLGWLPTVVFVLSAICLLLAFGYLLLGRASPNWQWNFSTLMFGAVTVAAVGVSLLIFRLQSEMNRAEANDQGLILARLERLARQTAVTSLDTRDFVREMQPAQEAASSNESEGALPESAAADLRADEDPAIAATFPGDTVSGLSPDEGDVIRLDGAVYYRPPAVPIQVLADLVGWWQQEGETGRWTISNLVGGYRQLNAKGGVTGKPWILTFKDSNENDRNFRIAYSGRGSGPTVSEHKQGVGWQNIAPPSSYTAN